MGAALILVSGVLAGLERWFGPWMLPSSPEALCLQSTELLADCTRPACAAPAKDAINVEGLTTRLPGWTVSPSRGAGLGLAAGAVGFPVSGLSGGIRWAN